MITLDGQKSSDINDVLLTKEGQLTALQLLIAMEFVLINLLAYCDQL